MEDLKAKLEKTEQELEEKWKLFDEQKNSELDRIEFERLKLQELENQERLARVHYNNLLIAFVRL